ncbi:unnamed protein product [Cuscuta epithymum]|uniref:TTF-type domain-containing protein n=1 Tax=Cuscuta epithymum TaxID=186058 RepID=A0AAV0DJW8_9ASTE|nr:unnamed protein product [Cuscuta epithymum]
MQPIQRTVHCYFKKRDNPSSESIPSTSIHIPSTDATPSSSGSVTNTTPSPISECVTTPPSSGIDANTTPSSNAECQWSSCIERDPGKRKAISEFHVDARDEIRRAYLVAGPYQPPLLSYKKTKFGNQRRSFQKNWFNQFKWLEYSPSEDKAYCFYCFLFLEDVHTTNISALATVGFDNWKRVNQGIHCAFLSHVGTSPKSSPHLKCVEMAEYLMRPSQHIETIIRAQTKEETKKTRLRLKTSIMAVRLLALQGCAFRGHDESSSSLNRGNFIELLKAFAQLNTEVDNVVLHNAPKNAQYISPTVHVTPSPNIFTSM